MYLITLEGGDGSGKGTATQILAEILESEFTFSEVAVTAEPRRNHTLGKLAVEAVRTGEAGPEQEAGFFAADRLDHSHTWILPRLSQGAVVISERNVHSSLVYQGVVGDLGVERIAALNSAAMLPDLTIWLDCEPDVALERISKGTLRMVENKAEYFETDEYQVKIRAGFGELFDAGCPAPFDRGVCIGPVMNHGSESDLRNEMKRIIRRFLHRRKAPLNVNAEAVECNLLSKIIGRRSGQRYLLGLGIEPEITPEAWLEESAPWRVLATASELYREAWEATPEAHRSTVPNSPLSHTVASIVGTLSLLPGADAADLRSNLGPVRFVSVRHTHRVLKFLHEQQGWVRRHKPLLGREAQRAELRPDWQAFGRLSLALWPLRKMMSNQRRTNPDGNWRDILSQILRDGDDVVESAALAACARLAILGSGEEGVHPPSNSDELRRWYRGSKRS
jgi:dTMP kinase